MQVFRRKPVCLGHHFCPGVAQDDLAQRVPCRRGRRTVRFGQAGQRVGHQAGHRFGQGGVVRDQPAGRCRPVFRLPGEVQRHEAGIGGGIGEDQDIGGACEHVDPQRAEQLALGLGDIGIAGTGEHICRGGAELAPCHGRDALHAADLQDGVGSGKMCGIEDGGIGAVCAACRGCGHHMWHAGGAGGCHCHQRRGDMGIAAAGDIAARAADRDHLLPHGEAGMQVGLEILYRGALCLGKAADRVMGIADGGFQVVGDFGAGPGDLFGGDADLAVPAIQPAGIVARGFGAAGPEPGQHDLNGIGDIGLGAGCQPPGAFYVADGHGELPLDQRGSGPDKRRAGGMLRC